MENIKASLNQLQQKGNLAAEIECEPYHQGDMPHSVRVAFASENGLYVGQFNDCKDFYIYQLSNREQKLIDVRAATTEPLLKGEQKQNHRAELVKDCQVLYSQSIGGPSAAKVIKRGVHSVKLTDGALISDIIEQLQQLFSNAPPPWLAKAMELERDVIDNSREEAGDD